MIEGALGCANAGDGPLMVGESGVETASLPIG